MLRVLNCHSRSDDPLARSLSNFTQRPFVLDGVQCGSMEGFLQALKFAPPYSSKIAALYGLPAYHRGQLGNGWKEDQILSWNGVDYARTSLEYQELLTRAYDVQFDQNADFKINLLASSGFILRHTMGKNDTRDTVLTAAEYVGQLDRLRWRALDWVDPL